MSEVQKMDEFYTVRELAARWKCGKSSVERYMRLNGCKVVDLAVGHPKGKKIVPAKEVLRLEEKRMRVYR